MAFPAYAKILYDGFNEEPDSALSRTQMEDGVVKQLQKVATVLVVRSVTIHINTLADLANFKTWFNSTLQRGASWFSFTDPVDGTTKQGRFREGKIKYSPVSGTKFQASAQLETYE